MAYQFHKKQLILPLLQGILLGIRNFFFHAGFRRGLAGRGTLRGSQPVLLGGLLLLLCRSGTRTNGVGCDNFLISAWFATFLCMVTKISPGRAILVIRCSTASTSSLH